MNFDIYGPFALQLPTREYERWRSKFWEDASQRYPDSIEGLKYAIGCYALCLTHGQSTRPWYVGKTIARTGFNGEIFQDHKLRHYKAIVSKHRGGPHLLLFPLLTTGSGFSRAYSSSERTVGWLERTLIGMALARNPDIVNERDTKMLRNVRVNGLIGDQNQGRPYTEYTFAKQAFLKR